jgi:tRNA nucleotidyltransferase (CCA-adding enzyme)
VLRESDLCDICDRLSMNAKEKAKIIDGKRQADQTLLQFFSWINRGYHPKRSEIYSLLHPLSTEIKLFMMAKTTQNATRRYISLYFTQLKDVKPLLRGADLIRLGIKPGPSVKKNLENLLKARLDEQVVTGDDEREFISRCLEVS